MIMLVAAWKRYYSTDFESALMGLLSMELQDTKTAAGQKYCSLRRGKFQHYFFYLSLLSVFIFSIVNSALAKEIKYLFDCDVIQHRVLLTYEQQAFVLDNYSDEAVPSSLSFAFEFDEGFYEFIGGGNVIEQTDPIRTFVVTNGFFEPVYKPIKALNLGNEYLFAEQRGSITHNSFSLSIPPYHRISLEKKDRVWEGNVVYNKGRVVGVTSLACHSVGTAYDKILDWLADNNY